jgi:two-component system NtrC family sensor kinase
MEKFEILLKIIKDAKDKQSLISDLIKAIDINDQNQQAILIENLNQKLLDFKLNNHNRQKTALREIHSARLSAMGQMAAAISHELRNPLSGIKVASEYLMRKLKNHPDAIDIIINIHNEVIFANNIITNILEHARISKPDFERSSIKKVVEEAILTIAQQGSFNNIQIRKTISGELPVVDIDVQQIKQVFINILINAAEAMIGGGSLKIKVFSKNNKIIIQIADTGSGIESSHLEKLFEPFFSTKVKGVGLGLAISKEIIENHNGTIDVESKLGKGTMFTITLPVVKKSRKAKKNN